MSVTGFFAIAWALPWRWALWVGMLGAVAMQLQWRLNDGVCVLTKLERALDGRSAVPRGDETDFIGGLAARLVGRPLPKGWTDRATYAVLWGSSGVSALRLLWS